MDRTVFSAKVTDIADPDGLGRVSVKPVGFDKDLELPWLRVLQPTASNSFGHIFVPEVGDEVLVLRGAGDDLNAMVVLGAVYNGKNQPLNAPTADNNIKQIVTRGGNELTLDDTSGSQKVTLQTEGGKIMIEMDHAGAKLTVVGGMEISITADQTITVEAMEVTVKGTSSVVVESSGTCDVKGTGPTTVKGNKTEVDGGPMLTLKGGMIQIG